LALKPVSVRFETAAAVPMAADTALQALRNKGNIQSDKGFDLRCWWRRGYKSKSHITTFPNITS
jgi:hypothetical protein